MGRLEEIRERALAKALGNINEARVKYDDNTPERMHPKLEKQLRDRQHSLGAHPAFPDSDEMHFEEKLMSKRFSDVVNNYKRQFDSDSADPQEALMNMGPLVIGAMKVEEEHRDELEDLAVKMIREEYDMSEDDVEIIAEITPNINIDNIRKSPSPQSVDDMEFDNHDSVKSANDEVYKRRFINSMIQGAAKKAHHMFHLVGDDLSKIDATLLTKYSKMMAAADYSYLTMDDSTQKQAGGVVRVEYEDGKPVIHAQAMVFPVLIHELVKGVMEILSTHGLPQDEKLSNYVTNKADFMDAETWDMRLGPAIWEKLTELIEPEDFNKKHQIYMELVKLPTQEFNQTMREIMLGSKAGKDKIKEIVDEINSEIENDDYEEAMRNASDSDDSMGYDDLDEIDLSGLM